MLMLVDPEASFGATSRFLLDFGTQNLDPFDGG